MGTAWIFTAQLPRLPVFQGLADCLITIIWGGVIEDCSMSVKGKVSVFSAYCLSNSGKIINCNTYADNLETFAYLGFAEKIGPILKIVQPKAQ